MKWFAAVLDIFGEQVEAEGVLRSVGRLEDEFSAIDISKIDLGDALFVQAVSEPHVPSDQQTVARLDSYVLLGDVRIDNRTEFLQDAGASQERSQLDDRMLMLQLYAVYGKKCVEMVYGEFAFVIWDKQERSLFAARDQLGARTLFWHKQGSRYWVASDLDCLQDVINVSDLEPDYLLTYYHADGKVDSEITPFRGVYRVPSAAWVAVTKGDVEQRTYWSLEERAGLIYKASPKEHEEQFRLLMKDSIRRRMGQGGESAVLMSGGLDSTTIYALGLELNRESSEQELLAVCGVFDRYAESDERQFIRPLLKKYGTSAVYEVCDDHEVLRSFPNDSPFTFEPVVNAVTYGFSHALYQRGRGAGVTRILTGYAGDHIMGGSLRSLADLLGRGRIPALLSGAYRFGSRTRLSVPSILWENAVKPRIAGKQKDLTFHQIDLLHQLQGTKARIYLDRVIAPRAGVESSHPFLDRRLIEFVFGLPGELLWEGGTTKVLLRNAMRSYLPEDMLRRFNKTDHMQITFQGVRNNWSQLYPALIKGRVCELGLISQTDWTELIHKWRQGMYGRDDLYVLLAIELWLYRYEKRFAISLTS